MEKHKSQKNNNAPEKSAGRSRSGKTKLYLLVLLVGVGLAIGGIMYKNDSNTEPLTENENILNNEEKPADNAASNYIEGVLKSSDNQAKGNLRLIADAGVIYLRTSRDFSSLIGSEVVVLIEGTLENFRMVDIQKKLEDNGFLKSN